MDKLTAHPKPSFGAAAALGGPTQVQNSACDTPSGSLGALERLHAALSALPAALPCSQGC